MKVWAIRRKGTEDYLPSRRDGKRRSRSGFTWDEPIPGGGEYGPRLFFKEVSARNALTAWLQGVWRQEIIHYGEFGSEVDVEVAPHEPPTPRSREDMEIVPFRLTEIRLPPSK